MVFLREFKDIFFMYNIFIVFMYDIYCFTIILVYIFVCIIERSSFSHNDQKQ